MDQGCRCHLSAVLAQALVDGHGPIGQPWVRIEQIVEAQRQQRRSLRFRTTHSGRRRSVIPRLWSPALRSRCSKIPETTMRRGGSPMSPTPREMD